MHKHFVSEVKRERCKILERRGGEGREQEEGFQWRTEEGIEGKGRGIYGTG